MIRGRAGRGGFLLVEALVSALLLLLLLQAIWWTIALQVAVAVRVSRGARVLDETRLVRHVVAAEIGVGRRGEDWALLGDELHLRAFRGMAFACRGQPSQGWGVAWSGRRNPNRAKDSVLVLSADGGWQTAKLVRTRRRQALDCPDLHGFERQIWTLDPAPTSPLAALFFERGAYRFSAGAFRYRRGAGWQPLTGADLDSTFTMLETAAGGGVAASMKWEDSGAAPWSFRWTAWSPE